MNNELNELAILQTNIGLMLDTIKYEQIELNNKLNKMHEDVKKLSYKVEDEIKRIKNTDFNVAYEMGGNR